MKDKEFEKEVIEIKNMLGRLHSVACAYTVLITKLESFYDFVLLDEGDLRKGFLNSTKSSLKGDLSILKSKYLNLGDTDLINKSKNTFIDVLRKLTNVKMSLKTRELLFAMIKQFFLIQDVEFKLKSKIC